MWSLDDIEIHVIERDADVFHVEVLTPAGVLEPLGAVSVSERVLHSREVHAWGLTPGALGRAGLNAIARKLLVEADVDEIVIEGGARTTGSRPGRRPRPFTFPR
jgi:hypothetical protein